MQKICCSFCHCVVKQEGLVVDTALVDEGMGMSGAGAQQRRVEGDSGYIG